MLLRTLLIAWVDAVKTMSAASHLRVAAPAEAVPVQAKVASVATSSPLPAVDVKAPTLERILRSVIRLALAEVLNTTALKVPPERSSVPSPNLCLA